MAESLFHAFFVERVVAFWRDWNFVQRDLQGFGLLAKKFAADSVHGDAIVGFGDGREERNDFDVLVLAEGVQGHRGVFAAGPAEEDGFRHGLSLGERETEEIGAGLEQGFAVTSMAKERPTLCKRRKGWGTQELLGTDAL